METAALLVIDEQVGAFDGKLLPAIHDGDLLLERTRALIDAARISGASVVFVQHCASEGPLVRGTDAWEIHPAVAPERHEPVVLKQTSNAFDAADLGRLLACLGATTVVLCGLQSEQCVANTSIGALELDFTVFVVGDAHSTWGTDDESAPEIIARQNQMLAEHGAAVRSTDELVGLLRARRLIGSGSI